MAEVLRVELTAHLIESAQAPATGQRFIRDTEQPGLALRITQTGVKAFIVESWVNGRSRRLTLGKHPNLSLRDARRMAKREIGLFASNRDVVAERQNQRRKSISLGEVFDSYLDSRELKPGTVKDYRRAFDSGFSDWKKKPVAAITRDMVERRHRQLGEQSKARANNSMRVLRALMNYAAGKFEDGEGRPIITDNPTRRLSATRAWYRVERRQTVIRPHQLPAWFEAVEALRDEEAGLARVARDYLLFLIFTGLRREEAARLMWADIDLAGRAFIVRDTKNRTPHELPLSDFLLKLLEERRALTGNSPFVFPGDGPKGHIVWARRWQLRVAERSQVPFTLHDLRRTFVTIAESLDIPAYALKRLLNHKSGADVTAGYIVIDLERMRGPMQKVTDYLKSAGNLNQSTKVLALPSK